MINYFKTLDENGKILNIGQGPVGENQQIITEEEYNSIKEQMILDFILKYGDLEASEAWIG